MSQILGEGQSVFIVSPHGLDQIRATFGDIFAYFHPDHTLDPRWQTDFLHSASRFRFP